MADFAPVSGQDYDRFIWIISGMIATGSELDGARYSPRNYTIVKATMHIRLNGGTAGNTIMDVNKNNVTLFTIVADRPTIAFNAGNDVMVEATPAITSLATADKLSVDVDTVVGAGFVQDVQLELIVRGRI